MKLSNIFENKQIKNHLDRIEKKGIMGIIKPPKINEYFSSDGFYYGELLYNAFLINSLYDIDLLNDYLGKLMPEKIEPADIKIRSWVNQKAYCINSAKQGQKLLLGYLSFQEDIGEVVKSGTAVLKLYDKNEEGHSILGYSSKPKNFTETGTCIRRISKVCLFPNEYLAQRNITQVTDDVLELMEYRLGQKKEELK
jgi:hypothetical protein